MMEDLNLVSRLFLASSKLNQASSWLEKLAKGQQPDSEGAQTLNWVGRFLSEVGTSRGASGGGGLSIQATSVRPTFYSSVLRIAPRFQEAGLNSDKEVIAFLERLNGLLLVSGSRDAAKKQQLDEAQYRLAVELLREVSRSILVQLSNNGLPRRDTLKEEWEPVNKQLQAAAYS